MADDYSEERLRKIMLEVIQASVPPIVSSQIKTIEDTLKTHTSILDSHTNTLKTQTNILGSHGLRLGSLQTDIRQIKEAVRSNGITLEDLEGRFTTLCEAVDENLNVRQRADDHENRLQDLESSQKLMGSTIKEHSRKLKG